MVDAYGLSGFMRGYNQGVDTYRQRKFQDQDRANAMADRAERQRLAQKQEARGDTEWQQQQQDRTQQQASLAQANEQKRQALAKQAEAEGLHTMLDSVEAGVNPAMIEQRMNSVGDWKIQPGSLQYDANSAGNDRRLSFTGAGGQQFNGTVGQLRALFNQPQQDDTKANLIASEKPIYNAKTGKWIMPPSQPEPPKFQEFDPKKDAYRINPDGTRTLLSRGTPSDAGNNGQDGTTPDGRKLSAYNPESHAAEAIKVANDGFKKKVDAQSHMIVLDNPDDSERQTYAADLASGFIQSKGADGAAYGAGEVGNAAFKSAKLRLTQTEAEDKVVKAGFKRGTPEFNQQVSKVIRDGDVRAAQVWNQEIDRIEANRKARDKKQNAGGEGKRPPLSSFQQ